ncbi:ARM repeat-containing protein [Ramaria rubella]|nr:ARM repeat-containing protein [Ramaria rubella]
MEDEGKLFVAFDKAPEFFDTLSAFLTVDLRVEPTETETRAENALKRNLSSILEEYHEQAYLLDPFLERMVTPVVEVFKSHATGYIAARLSGNDESYSSERLNNTTFLLYLFIKCRGRKIIVNFFPHQVADLSIALDYLEALDGPAQQSTQWSLRYIVLLWLSLICMIPFDLSRFDEDIVINATNYSSTAQRVQTLAIDYLSRAGLEREAAAILLSKLYSRKDASVLFEEFIKGAITWLDESPNYFKTIGVLQVLCEIIKSGITTQILPHVSGMRQVLQRVESNSRLLSNTVIRRLRVKLEGRLAVGSLPSRTPIVLQRGRALQQDTWHQDESQEFDVQSDDIDLPEEVELTITMLLEALQDKDTTVRYSSSKHLARISARLPPFLAEQVLDNVLQLFSIHGMPGQKMEDLPAVAEATWHGTCLTCAEMARRGLIPKNRLPELLDWLKKALLFDIRKGAHSVGSSVRDAASYVLWALARSQDGPSLKPHALSLAQRLVAVSLFDREIHIRRAASAAFQENVGRLSVFPHGIDIIRKTDFFAVGIRKNSFLAAAPQVAEHVEYRGALLDHLIANTLVHWDPAMRFLGAQSLKAICELDLEVLLLKSVDINDVHGGLLGLSQVATSYKARGDLEAERLKIFKHLTKLSPSMLQKHRNEQILEATCQFLAHTLSMSAIQLDSSPTPRWRIIIDQGLRHRETNVQEAAANAMQALSMVTDCSSDVHSYVREFAKGPPALQQSLARAFGLLAYDHYDHAVRATLTCLLKAVEAQSETFSSNVEARRNCFGAISQLLRTLDLNVARVLEPIVVHRILQAYIRGMNDYTTDERGDVGSWIRVASICGLSLTFELLFDIASSLGTSGSLQTWLPPNMYHEGLGSILKQGVERLDNVRRQAGEDFLRLLRRDLPNVADCEKWKVHGHSLLGQLFLTEDVGWHEGQWLFPRAVRMLEVGVYRSYVLHGLVLSVGSKTDSTQRPVATSLASYVGSLPIGSKPASGLDLVTITNDVLDLARKNLTSNQLVIPVLQTLDVLLDTGVLEKLSNDAAGIRVLQAVLDISTRNVTHFKNIQRIVASMKIVHGMLTIPFMRTRAAPFIPQFLLHGFPKVRTETAEHLYLVIQAKDLGVETDEAEDILLETDW